MQLCHTGELHQPDFWNPWLLGVVSYLHNFLSSQLLQLVLEFLVSAMGEDLVLPTLVQLKQAPQVTNLQGSMAIIN
jgi:hypothetical protein